MSTATLPRTTETDDATVVPAQPDDLLDSEQARQDTADPGAAPPARRWSPIGAYVSYVGYFVGAGLISGGIVHYPLDTARYGKIGVAGAIVFLLATLFQELVLKTQKLSPLQLARVAGASLLLSLGIGMLSGGIQHFTDFPDRGAVLVPAGLVLSFLAHAVRHDDRPLRTLRSLSAVAVLLIAVGALFALQVLAGKVAPQEGGHAHGATVATVPSQDEAHDPSTPGEAVDTHATTPASSGEPQGELEHQAEVLAELGARLQDLKGDDAP